MDDADTLSWRPTVSLSSRRTFVNSVAFVAIDLNLGPARLLPHSLRFGVLAQIELESGERKE